MEILDQPEKEPQSDQIPLPPVSKILLLLMFVFLGNMIGQAIVISISAGKGIDLAQLIGGLNVESPLEERNLVRLTNMIIHFLTFTIPSVVFVAFIYRNKWVEYLKLHRSPRLNNTGLGILFILAAFPVAQIAFWINQQFPFPEWVVSLENSTEGMIQGLLVMNSPAELMLNLMVVAVLPALGEELLFRGIIQEEIQKWSKRPILSIWIAALIFSAFHLQFLGFIPRVILGAALGYLFFWTNNLWVPIIAHFVTNGTQVVAQYLTKQDISQLDSEAPDLTIWLLCLLAIGFMIGLGALLKRNNPASG